MYKIFLLLFVAVMTLSTSAAKAGDEGLYPSAPPPGAAFIRFFNGNTSLPATITIRGKTYGAVSFGGISSYAPVLQGDATLSMGQKSASFHFKESAYYVVTLVKGNLSILEEPANDSKL